MKDLFDKSYKSPSGNKVTLDVDFIPWPDYYTRLNASLTSGEKKYQTWRCADSQWLGADRTALFRSSSRCGAFF